MTPDELRALAETPDFAVESGARIMSLPQQRALAQLCAELLTEKAESERMERYRLSGLPGDVGVGGL